MSKVKSSCIGYVILPAVFFIALAFGFRAEASEKTDSGSKEQDFYTIVFDPNDGVDYPYGQMEKVMVRPGEKVTVRPEDPIRPGYEFAGWVINGGDEDPRDRIYWDFDEMVPEHNITLWASWDLVYTIVFDRNDGISYPYEEMEKVTVKQGEKVTERPGDPERTGYEFAGWVVNGGDEDPRDRIYWDFDEMIPEHNITLWASWDLVYTVAFHRNDGMVYSYDELEKVRVKNNERITSEPDSPVREGYEFAGWCINSDNQTEENRILWDFENSGVTEDLILWASWDPLYTVAFHPNDGIPYSYEQLYKVQVKGGQYVDRPENPVRSGYTFLGWSVKEDSTGQEPVYWNFTGTPVEQDLILWAGWKRVYTATGEGVEGEKGGTTKPGRGRDVAGESRPLEEGGAVIEELKVPKEPSVPAESESRFDRGEAGQVPKTGDTALAAILGLTALCSFIVLVILLCIKKPDGRI